MLVQIVEMMPHTENVEEFLEKLGDFYEMVDDGADGHLSQRIKIQPVPPVKNGDLMNDDLMNGDKYVSTDSSSETSHSDLSSHTVIGVYLISRPASHVKGASITLDRQFFVKSCQPCLCVEGITMIRSIRSTWLPKQHLTFTVNFQGENVKLVHILQFDYFGIYTVSQ